MCNYVLIIIINSYIELINVFIYPPCYLFTYLINVPTSFLIIVHT
jgi:hypothetical protein